MIQETPVRESPVFPQPNPWKDMWFHPRATIRAIIERDSEDQVEVIAILLGISFFWWRASDILQFNVWGLVNALVVIGLGAIIGLVYILISGVLFILVGRLFGGVGAIKDGCAAIAWSAIPQIFTIPIPYLYVLLQRPPFADVYKMIWLGDGEAVLFGLMVALNLWGIILTIATFAEVHQFSIGKTIGVAIIISIPLGFLCFWCAMFLAVVFSPAI
jgi:Yip1 domain